MTLIGIVDYFRNDRHFDYFLTLEEDFIKAGRYAEICQDNWDTYSTEFTRLLLATGSEIDVVAKLVCARIDSATTPRTIDQWRKIITDHEPNFPAATVRLFDMEFRPWEEWATDNNPDWWDLYNKVKHRRDVHFRDATLKRVMIALGGLYIMCNAHKPVGFDNPSPKHYRWRGIRFHDNPCDDELKKGIAAKQERKRLREAGVVNTADPIP